MGFQIQNKNKKAFSCQYKYLYRCAGLPRSGGDTDHPIQRQFGAHN